MNAALRTTDESTLTLRDAIANAGRWIAPNWPLDRQIAVNPLWGQIDRPFEAVAASLRRLHGSRWTASRADFARALAEGEIAERHIEAAAAERGAGIGVAEARAALHEVDAPGDGLPLLSDVIDADPARRREPSWRDVITQQISQHCASYFDAHQADWHPGASEALFASWRERLQYDHAVERLTHAHAIRRRVQALPADPLSAMQQAIAQLGIEPAELQDLLAVALMRINGWASWCAYLAWEAGLAGGNDARLTELLAARLVWEALIDDGRRDAQSAWAAWRERWRQARQRSSPHALAVDLLWQRARELAYQERLHAQLARVAPSPLSAVTPASTADCAGQRPAAELVFCIDVRSERLRRALESIAPQFATRGYAGFFGLPLRYAPLGTSLSRAQVPGLLAPTETATDTTGDAAADAAIARRRIAVVERRAAWIPFQRLPAGAFALVETLGLTYLGKLLGRGGETPVESLGLSAAERSSLHPELAAADAASLQARIDRIEGVLRSMSLTREFARLLLLIGHGSQSANNPLAAGLDCGACGGNTGEVNARVLARQLNDPAIRAGLRARGIDVADDCIALGALHNTTTDEIEFFDSHALPASHRAEFDELRRALTAAGDAVRAERARSLDLALGNEDPARLRAALRRRARDWAQTRPEWGLAGNAAFILAPRARSRGAHLDGRVFLHDYAWTEDRDGTVLASLLAAPVVVAHWINLQYYASCVDPRRFGSGNKVLHNVVGGRIGVFEGNTGDLRIGLPLQSLHDGRRWLHTPLRLTVIVDAPRASIEAALAAHPTVGDLVANRWLYLWRFADAGLEECVAGEWRPLAAPAR